MILSVVIVSYNVKFFLEQCLSSLKKAVEGNAFPDGETEVFIVDNASTDGSLDFLVPLYPAFHFIQNKENAGFAKANNQVLSNCRGEFILFLNPDTILAEDSLESCISFFRSKPDAGALGVRMVDGAGNFLKESKRGFPSSRASFFKMSGLHRLFPHSKLFSSYYMGHLDEQVPQAVDILSGAFLMVKKNILDQTGGFDEQFFMYAEDIDLSYRIRQTGHLNYYLPLTSIIHFKGESTKRNSRYLKMFYSAMALFIKKHFRGSRSRIQLIFLHTGIRFHQALTAMQLSFKKSTIKKTPGLRIFVKGDPPAREIWKQKLTDFHIEVTEKEADAEEIIYCEGPQLSWKSIITEISKNKKRYTFKFHGRATHAAVGSASARSQGEVFEI
jgi:N-acetylglucosaminyl-diphospho-decaprenol L-rhamnosyltransferase